MGITVRYGSRLTEISPGLYAIDPDSNPGDPGLYVMGTYYGPDPADRTGVGFSWAGINFTQWGPFYLTKVDGWDDPPDGKPASDVVPGRHGVRKGRMTRSGRSVTIEGFCIGSDRDELFNQLADAMADGFGDGDESSPLVGEVAGRTLTADAQLQRYKPTVEQVKWGRRYFGWAVQFHCPDPMRYGPRVTVEVPIRVQTLGITFPVTGDWVFPADPVGGQARVTNPGNALADAVYTLRGPLKGPGVALIERGKQVRVGFDLADGDELVIDTAEALITLNGEYRPPTVDSAMLDELRLPRSTTSTIQALGTPQPGEPTLSVSTDPAYW